MNLKRAAWIGVVTYIISFIIGIIVMYFLGFDPSQASEIPNSLLYVNIILTIIIAALFTWFYFSGKSSEKKAKIKPSMKEGLLFGVVLIVVGFIIDLIIFGISSIATDVEQNIIKYYSNPLFWVAIVLLLVTTTLVGFVMSKKRK